MISKKQVLDPQSGWKGRSEQIAILKDKLKLLSKQASIDSLQSSTTFTHDQIKNAVEANDYNDKHKNMLKKIESERRHAQQSMAEELNVLYICIILIFCIIILF